MQGSADSTKNYQAKDKKHTHRLTLRLEGRIEITTQERGTKTVQISEAFRTVLKGIKDIEYKGGSAPKGAPWNDDWSNWQSEDEGGEETKKTGRLNDKTSLPLPLSSARSGCRPGQHRLKGVC